MTKRQIANAEISTSLEILRTQSQLFETKCSRMCENIQQLVNCCRSLKESAKVYKFISILVVGPETINS